MEIPPNPTSLAEELVLSISLSLLSFSALLPFGVVFTVVVSVVGSVVVSVLIDVVVLSVNRVLISPVADVVVSIELVITSVIVVGNSVAILPTVDSAVGKVLTCVVKSGDVGELVVSPELWIVIKSVVVPEIR